MAKKVFIGVGHGGSDAGAVANGFKEKDLNLAIANQVSPVLTRHGVTVLLSRTDDASETLTEKTRECNNFKPDLALDIHNNAGGGDGAEAYYHYGGGTGKVLAENILAELVAIGQQNRGAKIKKNSSGTDYFAFIRNTSAPAILLECAFMDSKDIDFVDTDEDRKKVGEAIAKGILKTLGITFVAETPVVSTPVQQKTNTTTTTSTVTTKEDKSTDGKKYYVQAGVFKSKANAEALKAKLNNAGFNAVVKVVGDVDGDNDVDTSDAQKLLKYAAGLTDI